MPTSTGPIVIPLGASYLDELALAPFAGARPILISRIPEPDEVDVPPGFTPESYPIEFCVIDPDPASTGLDLTKFKVWVRYAAVVGALPAEDLVFDGSVPSFGAAWVANSTVFLTSSPGSAVNDELRVQLVKDTPFVSLDRVEVRVQAETLDGATLDELYHFMITDLTTPQLISARSI
jgi:hypothetical protein